MIFGFVRKENIFLLQHYHPIRHIHCQIAVSEFSTDFDSWDMLTIIESRSPIQRSGTEAIRTQIQPSKPKRKIIKITNSQNTKRTYGKPSEQLFPKRWPLIKPSQTKNYMNTCKVKRHRNSDTKNRQQRTTTNLPP